MQELQIGGTSDTPMIADRLHQRWILIRLPAGDGNPLLGRWPSYRYDSGHINHMPEKVAEILRQAWHGCNIPPDSEQICIFCHATAENDGVTGPVAHIVKL